MVDISWSTLALRLIPFQLPIDDSKCLAYFSDTEWNLQHYFYTIFYFPVLIFALLLRNLLKHPKKSPERVKAASTLIFLMTLWYSPVLKTTFNMVDCINKDGSFVLASDPSVTCSSSYTGRVLMFLHGFVVVFVVGIGFPLYALEIILNLQRRGSLNEESSFYILYRGYNDAAPWFEVVHFVRKALLILGSLLPNAMAQSFFQFTINVTFLVLLIRIKPHYFSASTILKKRGYREINFFLLFEVMGAIGALGGSLFAVLAALYPAHMSTFEKVFSGTLGFSGFMMALLYLEEIQHAKWERSESNSKLGFHDRTKTKKIIKAIKVVPVSGKKETSNQEDDDSNHLESNEDDDSNALESNEDDGSNTLESNALSRSTSIENRIANLRVKIDKAQIVNKNKLKGETEKEAEREEMIERPTNW
jgi:hypothetical protein